MTLINAWYPAWYRGGYPDAEKAIHALFSSLLTGVNVCTYLPSKSVELLDAGEVFLRIARTSGHINGDQNRDQARLQIAALTQSRDSSWELIEFVRQVLEAINVGGGMWVAATKTQIRACGEVVGPQLIPESIREHRLIPVTYDVWIGQPKGQPDISQYPQALGL